MRSRLFILVLVAAVATAFHLPLAHRRVVEREWVQQQNRLPSSTPHSITLLLHNNPSAVAELSDLVARVSTPSSPSYGKYWDLQQVADTFAPAPSVLQDVVAWAREALDPTDVRVTLSRDFVSIDTTVGAIERALSCTMHAFHHRTRRIVRTRTRDAVQLPARIAPHVHLVLGLSDFLSPPKPRRFYDSLPRPASSAASGAAVNETAPSVGPRDVWAAYSIDYAGSPLSSVAVSAFEEQYALSILRCLLCSDVALTPSLGLLTTTTSLPFWPCMASPQTPTI
jgi:subtilase family serine protease